VQLHQVASLSWSLERKRCVPYCGLGVCPTVVSHRETTHTPTVVSHARSRVRNGHTSEFLARAFALNVRRGVDDRLICLEVARIPRLLAWFRAWKHESAARLTAGPCTATPPETTRACKPLLLSKISPCLSKGAAESVSGRQRRNLCLADGERAGVTLYRSAGIRSVARRCRNFMGIQQISFPSSLLLSSLAMSDARGGLQVPPTAAGGTEERRSKSTSGSANQSVTANL